MQDLFTVYALSPRWRFDLVATRWSPSMKLLYAGPGYSTGISDRVGGSTPGAGNLSQYITSHPGQLSLAIPPWVGGMSTSQRAVGALYDWGVKVGVVRCDPLANTGHIRAL